MAWERDAPAPPPRANIQLEQALLGAVLVDNGALDAIADFDAGFLSEPLHRQLYTVILKMRAEGRTISPLTLKDYVPLQEIAPGLTFPQYLARLAAEACATMTIVDYAKTIRDLATLRGIIAVGQDAERSATAFTHPREAVAGAYADLDALRMGFLAKERATNAAAGPLAAATIDLLYAKIRGENVDQAAKTGLADLDEIFGGLIAGDLVVVAGRPGAGKTTVALSLARATCLNNPDLGVGFFSLEMSDRQIGARLLADLAYDYWVHSGEIICATDIIRARFDPAQEIDQARIEQLKLAAEEAERLPIWFEYQAPISIGELAAKIRMMQVRLMRKFGAKLGVVFVDYLNFIQSSTRYAGNRNNEIGEITQALKSLAKELGVCIVLLSQLNRKVEERAEKRPQLADLRESGNIEQDADSVIFLYREAYYLQQDPNAAIDPVKEAALAACQNKLELIIGKNRMGPTGNISVFIHPGASAVRNLPKTA